LRSSCMKKYLTVTSTNDNSTGIVIERIIFNDLENFYYESKR
jgi:hypothetical protein